MHRIVIVFVALLGCGESPKAILGAHVRMDFERNEGFYTAPMPSADLFTPEGGINLAGYPKREMEGLVQSAFTLLESDTRGAGLNSGVFLPMTEALNPELLPDLHASVQAGSPVFLMDVDVDSPELGQRLPVTVRFREDGGPFGAPNLLSLLPLQGAPLRPNTLYAAVVLRSLLDASGAPLGRSANMHRIWLGRSLHESGLPPEAQKHYAKAVAALKAVGLSADDVSGITVFRTGDPTDDLRVVRDYAVQHTLPQLQDDFVQQEVFDTYCTFRGTVEMPVFQDGAPPYLGKGGRWQFSQQGIPELQAYELANIWVSLPRQPVPTDGFPLTVFIRTGGGGERPMIDRGRRDSTGYAEPGSGPAVQFSSAGFAGLSVDGPHGGRRNVSGGDEQLLMFNIFNPAALRDNIRQSALELILLARVLQDIAIDASDCPGLTSNAVSFDVTQVVLMGHSMGATIAPLVGALEESYKAVILSGGGASWIENVIHKENPLPTKPAAELLIGYDGVSRSLHTHDPILSIVQWAADSADPLSYARNLLREPQGNPVHVLMLQGIVDTYIYPPIANALSLSLGLDLAGPSLDAEHPGLTEFSPLHTILPLVNGQTREFPVLADKEDATIAIVIQHEEDGIEDGHEVVFQLDGPKAQYTCFLKTLLAGTPMVPDAAALTPCAP